MSRPTFLPALRGLLGGGRPPAGTESKALTIASPGTISLTGHTSQTIIPAMYEHHGSTTARADAWDVEMAVATAYERVVWVYRCVELMSGDASRLPFRIGRDMGTDSQEILDDHPLYRVLNRRANPHERARDFRKRLGATLLLSKKGAFIEVTRSRAGTINRLDLMHPARVNIVQSQTGEYVDHFQYTRLNGEVIELDPSRVKWIKEPHPLDPFSGTTPLEAAGMSVELDFLSRVYNVQFIKNDSRPGGIVGVDADGLDDRHLERLERQFEPGAHAAGKITVLGTGPGGVSYVDTTTRPRDMAYNEAAQNAKNEVLAAFGFGESVLGNASGRTFDNAEQELYNYWTGPMTPYTDLMATAFDDDVDDEWDCFLDTSEVQVLELPRRRRREEALKEYLHGLRSIDEYRPLADLPPLGTPQGRALWISPNKAPLATDPADEAALNGAEDAAAGEAPAGEEGGAGADVPLQENGLSAAEVVAAARAEGSPAGTAMNAVEGARAEAVDASTAAQDAVDLARIAEDMELPEEAAAAVAAARMEGKALDGDEQVVAEAPDDGEYTRVAMAVAAALEAEFARQSAIISARLESPKIRKGTRYWEPAYETDTRAGDAQLDAAAAVNAEKLGPAAVEVVGPIAHSSATDAATAMLTALAAAGLFGEATYTAAELASVAGFAAQAPATAVMAIVLEAVANVLDGAENTIRARVVDADNIGQVVAAVRDYYLERGKDVAEKVGETVAYATINGARDAAADMLLPMPGTDLSGTPVIEREWVSRRDDRVRPEHALTDGAALPVGTPFVMPGGSLLYPRDPSAPPHLTYGCRCRLRYYVTYRRQAPMLLPTIG